MTKLESMTREEISQFLFDKVTRHLAQQKERAMDTVDEHETTPMCVYYSDEGLRCAVGCLIDSECYEDTLEGMTVREPQITRVLSSSLGIRHNEIPFELLNDLQNVHDVILMSEWGDVLALVGRRHELNTTATTKLFQDFVPKKTDNRLSLLDKWSGTIHKREWMYVWQKLCSMYTDE